jgi:hypothetical protein
MSGGRGWHAFQRKNGSEVVRPCRCPSPVSPDFSYERLPVCWYQPPYPTRADAVRAQRASSVGSPKSSATSPKVR